MKRDSEMFEDKVITLVEEIRAYIERFQLGSILTYYIFPERKYVVLIYHTDRNLSIEYFTEDDLTKKTARGILIDFYLMDRQ